MNREIKFRIWDGTSFYFASVSDLLDGYPSEHKCLNSELVFQQFTGLEDKNGKEIYEGDILRFYKNKPYQADYEVYWEKYGFSLISAKRDGDDFGVYTKDLHFFKRDKPEIIGNIFENPELLENA